MSTATSTVGQGTNTSGEIGQPLAARKHIPYSMIVWNDATVFRADSMKGLPDLNTSNIAQPQIQAAINQQ